MPTEHLVILSRKNLTGLKSRSRPLLKWKRKRQEPPVGAVKKEDVLFFKEAGGKVIAEAIVSKVRESWGKGNYVTEMGLKKLKEYQYPFPIVKRDRRSWVVCEPKKPADQQPLIKMPVPRLDQLLKAAEKHQKKIPSKRELEKALRHFASQKNLSKEDAGALFLITLLLAIRMKVYLPGEVKKKFSSAPSSVYPFAVFS